MSREGAKKLLSHYLWQIACDCRGDVDEVASIVDEIVDAAVAEARSDSGDRDRRPRDGGGHVIESKTTPPTPEPKLRRSVKDRLLDLTGMSFSPQRAPQCLYDKNGEIVLYMDNVIHLHSFIQAVGAFVVAADEVINETESPKSMVPAHNEVCACLRALTRLPEGI